MISVEGAIGVPEYWIINPETQTVLVLELQRDEYQEVGLFREGDRIGSPMFPAIDLTVGQVFQPE